MEKIAHNGQEALKLLKEAEIGDVIIWDELTPLRKIYQKFTKQISMDIRIEI